MKIDTNELREEVRAWIATFNMDTTVGGLNEEQALDYQVQAIEAYIADKVHEAWVEELEQYRLYEPVLQRDRRLTTLRKELDHLSKNIEPNIEHQGVDIETKIKDLPRPDHRTAQHMIEVELDVLARLIHQVTQDARRDEWNLIHETLHSAAIVSEMHINKIMDERLAELKDGDRG